MTAIVDAASRDENFVKLESPTFRGKNWWTAHGRRAYDGVSPHDWASDRLQTIPFIA